MTLWTPVWSLTINGYGEFNNLTLSTVTVNSGRTDIYSQAYAGYCNFQIINLDESPIILDVNDQILLKVKDTNNNYVNIFGGYITDIDVEVVSAGPIGVNEIISITALGALSKLPKSLFLNALTKDYDGNQIYTVLSQALFDSWNEVPAATTWATYDASTTWTNAENSGMGEIDTPGNYELTARAAESIDIYSLATSLASSGLGYLYEDSQGRIGYADSTHRSQYLAANGYVELNANDALSNGIKTTKKSGDIRNKVILNYKNNQEVTASDASSISFYGEQAYNISTSIENLADAQAQADYYLTLRAFPQAQFSSITFPLHSPEMSDSARNSLLNVFMGMPVNLSNLPTNINGGTFQGFVEGWTFTVSYNGLYLTLVMSPVAYSLQAFRWNDVPIAETWNSLIPTLEWLDATIVA